MGSGAGQTTPSSPRGGSSTGGTSSRSTASRRRTVGPTSVLLTTMWGRLLRGIFLWRSSLLLILLMRRRTMLFHKHWALRLVLPARSRLFHQQLSHGYIMEFRNQIMRITCLYTEDLVQMAIPPQT